MTCIRCYFDILEELTKLFVCPNQVGFVVANIRCYQNVNLGKEELHPRRRARNEGDLARKFSIPLTVKDLRLLWNGLRSCLVVATNAGGTLTSSSHVNGLVRIIFFSPVTASDSIDSVSIDGCEFNTV